MEHQQLNSGGNPPHLPPATPGTQQGEDNKITPELLVDALSGHEDGLLSIAERLMTHYDSGYDASEFRFERYFASSEGDARLMRYYFLRRQLFQWERRSSTRSPTYRSCSSTWSR